jgi:hypothetical protein
MPTLQPGSAINAQTVADFPMSEVVVEHWPVGE